MKSMEDRVAEREKTISELRAALDKAKKVKTELAKVQTDTNSDHQ